MTVPQFRLIAVAEAVTWLVLIAATVAKRAFEVEGATTVIGPIHGVVFLAYLAGILLLRNELGWSARRSAAAVVASVVPLGAWLIVERGDLAVERADRADLAVDGGDLADEA